MAPRLRYFSPLLTSPVLTQLLKIQLKDRVLLWRAFHYEEGSPRNLSTMQLKRHVIAAANKGPRKPNRRVITPPRRGPIINATPNEIPKKLMACSRYDIFMLLLLLLPLLLLLLLPLVLLSLAPAAILMLLMSLTNACAQAK